MLKKVVVLGIVVVVAAGGLFWWRKTSAALVPAESALETAVAQRGPVRQLVQCTGRIVSNLDVEIKCRASGEVLKLPFDISDPVKKGDLLLELDPVEQERAVEQGKASLAAAEARLAQSENNLVTAQADLVAQRQKVEAAVRAAEARATDAKAKAKREQELLERKFSSPEQAETARTTAVQSEQDLQTARAQLEDIRSQELALEGRRQDIRLNKAQLNSSQIELALRQRQLTYTKVYAPIDGVVADRKVQIGQIISSGVTNVGGGTTVMLLSDLSRVFILASVDESNIGFVKLGQPATVTVDAYPQMTFEGSVNRIATTGVSVQNVVKFEVRIEVLSENKALLKPEMTANVWILAADKPDALLVPLYSILREADGSYVEPMGPDGLPGERRLVQTGVTDGVQTEILAGLQEGDTVVVYPPETESRWRAEQAHQQSHRDRMMMRTVGGGAMRGPRR